MVTVEICFLLEELRIEKVDLLAHEELQLVYSGKP